MIDATPDYKDTRNQTIQKIARAYANGEPVRLGRYVCRAVECGWKTQLYFDDADSDATHSKIISRDGPTHAAMQTYRWWTVDAWHV